MPEESGVILIQLRERKSKTQEEVAEEIGSSQTVISRHERGKPFGRNMLERYAKYYEVSTEVILGKEPLPPMVITKVLPTPLPTNVEVLEEIPYGPTVKIPVLGRIRAGMPVIVQEEIVDWQEVPADSVRGGDYFLLEVSGDSMIEAFIPPGSRVLVRRQEQVDQGDIAVVIVNGNEATVKRVRCEDGEISLIPANPRYVVTKHHPRDVQVVGKVVQAIMRFE